MNRGSTFVGIDVAARRDKGCHVCVADSEGVRDYNLKFARPVRLQTDWPFVDLPLDALEDPARVFSDGELGARLVEDLGRAHVVAVDAPPGLPDEGRRSSELRWHRLSGKPYKKKVGGIFWTPTHSELTGWISSILGPGTPPDLDVLNRLAGVTWMLVGFWWHELLRRNELPAIEVFPSASRKILQAGFEADDRVQLDELHRRWSKTVEGVGAMGDASKSDRNDARLASFTGFLWAADRAVELAPGELVIPRPTDWSDLGGSHERR